MENTNRRTFLQATAAAGVLGVGGQTVTATGQPALAEQHSVPAYADWVPEDDIILDDTDEVSVTSLSVPALIELFDQVEDEEDEDDEEDDEIDNELQFEAFLFGSFLAFFEWGTLDDLEIAEPVLGQTSEQAFENPQTTDIPAERHTGFSDSSVYTGSFDTDALATAAAEGPLEETEQDGIFSAEIEFFGEQFVTWGDSYVIVSTDIDELNAILETGTGGESARHEVEDDFERLIRTGGHGDFALTRLASGDEITITEEDEEFFEVDYDPVVGSRGYAHSNWVDIEALEIEATTIVSYASEDRVDMERIDGLGRDAAERSVRRDGRFVTVNTFYREIGLEDEEMEDSDEGDTDDTGDADDTDGTDDTDDTDETDDTDGTGDEEMDDTDDTDETDDADETTDDDTDDADDADDADDDGAGFGVIAALSGLGGAGYLLSQRLGHNKTKTDQQVRE